jgi:single-stranded-DNA-specific exonuclease
MLKNWNILTAPQAQIDALHNALKISKTLCKILVQRGHSSFDLSKNFFRPNLTDMHSPWLMKDMDKAVARVLKAFEQQEKILVFGDYDVDGTTSVSCMYRFLKSQYEQVDFYIPHRYREGYGVSKLGIDFAHQHGFSLIISLDCGIKSVALIAYAKTLGIDFVVCDHHLPEAELPPAVAILNAKQKDCPYPYKELCGCGVGYKLITALCEKLQLPANTAHAYLDLLATAIAADIVPMTGENRVMAYYGLQRANTQPNIGIKALSKLSGLTNELHITNLVFMIAPRVNAAGRMDDARKAVELFIEDDETRALDLAEQLHNDNTDRKEADKTITEEALAIVDKDPFYANKKTTVLFQPHWHKGVVGIVASRIIEHHYRPTIVLTQSGEYCSGSARSVEGFNLYEAIHACREFLLGYGGHFAAAGLTLLPENLEPFKKRFDEVVQASIEPASLVPEIKIDAVIRFDEINTGLYKIIQQMEPFGPENLRPVFLAQAVVDTGHSKVVKEAHLRVVLKQGNITYAGIGFGMADKYALLANKQPVDIVFTIDENDWQGEKSLQLRLVDLRSASS